MYEAVQLLNKHDLFGNRTKENTIYLKARPINLLMRWRRKRKWDCIWGINLQITDKKKKKEGDERWDFERTLVRQESANSQHTVGVRGEKKVRNKRRMRHRENNEGFLLHTNTHPREADLHLWLSSSCRTITPLLISVKPAESHYKNLY